MRFLMVSIFYPPYSFGGDAIYLQRLCQELTRRGHEVDVAHCGDAYGFFGRPPKSEASNRDGVVVHRLESSLGKAAPLLAHQLGRPLTHESALRRLFLSKPYDVVHFHNISLFGPKVLELPVPPDALKVYTAHEHWLVCPLSVLWKFGDRPCDSPECIACQVRAKRPPQLWRYTDLLDRAAAHVDLFLASSRFTVEMHNQRGFNRPMQILPPFADICGAGPGASPHSRPYFLFVGRLERYKGLDEILPEFFGDGEFDLLAAGDGVEYDRLERLAASHSRIKLLGWVPQDSLGDYYRHALGVILPSLGYETFGLVAIEAMAHGAPVIGHRRGPLPEIIESSGGGLLYRTPEELSECCRAVGFDRSLRQRLASAGQDFQRKNWSPDAHLKRYLELLESVRDHAIEPVGAA